MNTRPVLLAVLLFTTPAVHAEGSKWTRYNIKSGKCSVLLPNDPARNTNQIPMSLSGGKVTVNEYMAFNNVGVFMVCISELQIRATDKLPPSDQLLEGVTKEILSSANFKVVTEKKITFGKTGHPGRDLLAAKKNEDSYLRARYYLIGNRVYALMMVSDGKAIRGNDATKFLDSFRLTD